MLKKWIEGIEGIIGVEIIYLYRIENEEEMMREDLGYEYEEY